MDGLWIPITIAAALFQNLRTAVQRHLKGRLSTNGAALTRFAYGFPFAALYVLALNQVGQHAWPAPGWPFFGWVTFGGLTQIIGTALLLQVLGTRNFAVGIAYSKTEVVQAALFGLLVLGEALTGWGVAAVMVATLGVMLFSLQGRERVIHAFLTGWTERSAILGMASGGMFGISAVAFRAASTGLGHESFLMAAGYTLAWATFIQTMLLGAWLMWREPGELRRVAAAWRTASLAGFTGVVGSACWFTAMTIQIVAYVRTLGLIELVFTFAIGTLWFRERTSPTELAGILMLLAGLLMVLNPAT